MRRAEFTAKTKVAAFQRANGRCEREGCGAKLTVGKYEFDHRLAAELGGDASLGNCVVLCLPCHREKTGKHDVPRIAKAKRQERAHLNAKPRSRRPMPGSKDHPWKHTIGRGWVRREP